MKRRSAFGWFELLSGILFLVLGIVLLSQPGAALTWLVLLLGLTAIVSGVLDIIWYIRLRKNTRFDPTVSLVMGIISIIAGLLLLFNPVIGRWVLNIVIPVWLMAHCIARIANYGFTRATAGKGVAVLTLCLNVLGLLFSVILLFNPSLFTISAGVLIAINLILFGTSSIIEAFSGIGARNGEHGDENEWRKGGV